VAGLLALLLLSLIWIALRSRFSSHQIRPIATHGQQELLLRGMGTTKSRDAFGTPDVENAVHFRIRGHHPFTRGKVRVMKLLPDAAVFVNGQEVADARWARVRHGDEVVVQPEGGGRFAYWYFDREPSEEELQAKLAGYFVALGPDEFVIMGL
jgi:hypothetical protein